MTQTLTAPADPLEVLVDKVLIETLPAIVKASLDRLLKRGESPASILEFCQKRGCKRPLMVLAVEAYLRKAGGGQ